MDNGGPMLFALDASQSFGRLVVEALGTALSAHEERTFEDGEHKSRPLVSVRGRDVYVIHSLYAEPGQSANDKLVRLLLFLGALKDATIIERRSRRELARVKCAAPAGTTGQCGPVAYD